MVSSARRVIIHVDLDYFFAQIEETKHPEYQDRPVVICVYSGRTEDSGAVSTANYVARKFGVRSGMPILWAKRRLTNSGAVFLPVNLDKYRIVSSEIMTLLRTYGERFEQVSIDEAFLEVSERVRGDYQEAAKLAKQIKEAILGATGLTCSVGVGQNKLIAKIAANQIKPDGLTVIPPSEVKDFLHPLPVGRLLGVGRRTEKIMIEKRLRTIGELADYPIDELIRTFGKVSGIYFHDAANGVDESEVQERGLPKSLSRMATLKKNTRDTGYLLPVLEGLCETLYKRVETEGLAYRTMSLVVVAEDMSMHTKSLTFEHTSFEKAVLKKGVSQLLEDYLKESTLHLRRVGVRLSVLSSFAGQKNLGSYLG